MKKSKLRITALICNILICILSFISVGSYFILPLWKVEASYNIPEKTIEKLLQDVLEESAAKNEQLKNIDISDLVDEEGLTVSLSISLRTQDVLSSLGNKGPEVAQKIIDDNINNAVDTFSGTLNKVAKALTKTVTKNALHYVIEEKLSEVLPEDEMVEEIETILADVGIDTNYITNKTDELVDIIFSDNATVESIAQDVMVVVEEVCDKLANSENEYLKNLELSEENKEFIHSTMTEVLAYVADEEGNIDVDGMIAEILVSILDGSFNVEDLPLPEEASAQSVKHLSASSEAQSSDNVTSDLESGEQEPSQEEKDAQEELKALLRDKFMELLPKNTTKIMAILMKIVSVLLLLTFATWLYLVLKILLKLGCKNNAIRVKMPILFGWWPFVSLYAFPTLIFKLSKAIPSLVASVASEEIANEFKGLSDGFNVTYTSGSWVSFVAAVFLAFFSIFFYCKLYKKLKLLKTVEEDVEDVVSSENKPAKEKSKAKALPAAEEPTVTETAESAPIAETTVAAEVAETAESAPVAEESVPADAAVSVDDEIKTLFNEETLTETVTAEIPAENEGSTPIDSVETAEKAENVEESVAEIIEDTVAADDAE